MKKVMVIGLDGLEPKIVTEMMLKNELPNLAKLRDQGGFSTIKTTSPAQTPVAWSTFATGTNPGAHGIFDFVSRDVNTYLPDMGLNRFQVTSKYLPPKLVNMRRGIPMWNVLSEAGVNAAILRCPCSFPPDKLKGKLLSGMGVPDLRGGLGTSTFYSSSPEAVGKESENLIRISDAAEIRTHLPGPLNARTNGDFRLDIRLAVNKTDQSLTIQSSGQPKALLVKQGEWSDWLHVKFKQGLMQSTRGIVRFFLASTAPYVELYASPVNYDPTAMHLYPLSFPADYAGELADNIGTFHTTGMVEDHGGLNNERFDEYAFLHQCAAVLKEREKMMLYELNRFKEGLFYCLFDTPDRVQHMFWRFREADHPANKGANTEKFKNVIEEHYRECDAILGKAMAFADDDTLLICLSDHGFNSFQRGVNLNTWLQENGFLKLKNNTKPGDDDGDFFPNVDWSETKAYALGLSGIFLNLRGREAKGAVKPTDAEQTRQAIIRGLSELQDSKKGSSAIRSVMTREQIYSGKYAEKSPDLMVNFNAGYRVSWSTAMGGIPAGFFEDNTRKWSGDHCIDPALVPGVLFMNRKFNTENASLLDMAPTILNALGVEKLEQMEGDSLLTDQQVPKVNVSMDDDAGADDADGDNEQSEQQIRDRLKGLGYI